MLRVSVLLLAFWLPYLALMYPGNLSNDTTGQLTMFYTMMGHGEYWLSAQHPVFDTLVFGAITYPFYAAGLFQWGVFFCILLQEACTAFAVSLGLVWARRRWRVSRGLAGLLLVFMCACPVVPLMVASLSKDTFFSWIYVIWLLFFFDAVRSGRIGRGGFIVLLFSGALMCLTKKYGFCVAFISTFALGVAFFARWLRMRKGVDPHGAACAADAVKRSVLLLVSVLVALGAMSAMERALNAGKAAGADMVIVPIQQTAMCYSRHAGDYSDDDLEIVEQFVDTGAIDAGQWYPQNTDSIKRFGHDGLGFLEVWARMGLRHPGSYLDGWATLEAPLFTFGPITPLFDNHWHNWSKSDVIAESLYDKPGFAEAASKSIEEWYQWLGSVPGVNLLLAQALFAVIVPAYFLSVLLGRGGRGRRVAFVPVLVSFLALLISPMVQPHFETMRYLVPFVYSMPLTLLFASSCMGAGVTGGSPGR